VTAGGTSEPIDDVRVVTNRSSGKMGLSLAEECLRRGAQVIFLRSKTALQTYLPMKQLTFETSHELEELIRKYIKNSDIVFHTAAVSDFIIDKIDGKIESKNDLKLNLTPALKILNMLKKWNADITLIGFKAIYGDVTDLILKELTLKKNESKADAFVINNIARDDIGFESDENEVDIFFKRNKIIHLPKKSKKEIACEIINTLLTNEILH
jgi:phosphopantothenoylcysteine decarboxylase/phosphopantothenate--cysteine ligase